MLYTLIWESYPDQFEELLCQTKNQVIDHLVDPIYQDNYHEEIEDHKQKLQSMNVGHHFIIFGTIIIRTV